MDSEDTCLYEMLSVKRTYRALIRKAGTDHEHLDCIYSRI